MPQPPIDRNPAAAPAPAGTTRPAAAGLRAFGVPAAVVLAAALLAAAGCRESGRALRPQDLSRDEAAYVDRVLVLERVRAALLVDAVRGVALGDSLAAAWGDSALPQAVALAPTEPGRAELVHELLLRLLAAEQDSLLAHNGLRRLDAPWPTPADSVAGAGFPGASRVPAGE